MAPTGLGLDKRTVSSPTVFKDSPESFSLIPKTAEIVSLDLFMNKFGTGGWALLAVTGCRMEAQGTWNHFTKRCESIVSPNRQVNIKFEGQGALCVYIGWRILRQYRFVDEVIPLNTKFLFRV